jgi:hypothetical protein
MDRSGQKAVLAHIRILARKQPLAACGNLTAMFNQSAHGTSSWMSSAKYHRVPRFVRRSPIRRAMILCIGAMLSTTTALAKDCRGINFPDHAVVEGTDLRLNGIGLHKATFFRVDVYVGALYVAATSRDPNTLINSDRPQELILHFLRSVNVKVVRDQWTKDFVHVVPDRPASLMQRVATLNTWLSDLKSDQRLTFVRQPGEGIKVVVGGVLKGTVPGDDFSRVFMSIWLGAAPPSAELRAGLLGGSCD